MKITRTFDSGTSASLPYAGGLLLIFGAHGGAPLMLDLAARLSVCGPVRLVDCGNRSNMYRVARTLRALTADPVTVLRQIQLSRAFTCYQVVTLLEKIASGKGTPVLVLDLLATFMDESVQASESGHLFERALQCLLAVSAHSPVVVSARPLLLLSAPRFGLLEQLKRAASQVWEEDEVLPARTTGAQLSLLADY